MKWDLVIEELGPRLYRYFCVRFDAVVADDLTQDTLIRLLQKVDEGLFRPQLGTLQMFAFGIANYVAMEQRRREICLRHQVEVGDEVEDVRGDSCDELVELREKILRLGNLEQQVLSLSLDEDFKLADIAKLLDIPENTVKSHVRRAKQKLKAMYEEEDKIL